MKASLLRTEVPGLAPICLTHLVLDFTGTLSLDGGILPGVAGRIRKIATVLRVTIATADTFGTAKAALKRLAVEVQIVATGSDKAALVRRLGPKHTVAIGNGRNDVPMVRAAVLGIAVIGPEGACSELVSAADVVVRDIRDALDPILNPLRLKATLRE